MRSLDENIVDVDRATHEYPRSLARDTVRLPEVASYEEVRITSKNLRNLRTPFYMAQEVGKSMG